MTAQEKFDEFVRDTTVLEHFAKLTLDTKREILRDWLLGEDVSDQCEEVLFDVRGDFTPKQHRELGVALVSSFKDFLNDDRKDWLNEHLETPFKDDEEEDEESDDDDDLDDDSAELGGSK
jgi:hypothetical protein